MSDIEVLYLQPDHKYRRRPASTLHKWAVNDTDRQAHTISSDRLFVPNDPVLFQTKDELLEIEPPEPPRSRSKVVMAVESSAILPLHPDGPLPPSMAQLEVIMSAGIIGSMAKAEAEKNEAHENLNQSRLRWFNATLLAIVLIFGVVVFWLVFGEDFSKGITL